MPKRSLPGINIQYPWSELILSGKKKIETRSYPLPKKFEGMEIAVIETPGKQGKKVGIDKARITGTVTFSGSKRYGSREEWRRDFKHHLVEDSDPLFSYSDDKPKYGWIIKSVTRLSSPTRPPASRGIIFAKGCKV